MEKAGHRNVPLGWRDFVDTPIPAEELKAAVSIGACNQAPRRMASVLNLLNVTDTASRVTC